MKGKAMTTPHQLQFHRHQLTAFDQSRRRKPSQAEHWHRSQRSRATVDQPTRAARRTKGTTFRRQEAKEL